MSAARRRAFRIPSGRRLPPLPGVRHRRLAAEERLAARGGRLRAKLGTARLLKRPTAPPPPAPPEGALEFRVAAVVDPELGDLARPQAIELLRRVGGRSRRPVLRGRVTVRRLANPALERPVEAKATLDVGGRPVRAHVAAPGVEEALARLEERLRRNLEDLEGTIRSRRRRRGAG